MSLHITELSFRNFRSYETLDLCDIGSLTVFVGPNAAGKTNIVEGIQLMTALAPLRQATADQLICRGASTAKLSMRAEGDQSMLDIDLCLEGGRRSKRYRLNGKARRAHELKGLVPSVAFTPDDLDLVKGAMGARRRALDLLGSQINANYHVILKDYERVLKNKNRLLKDNAPDLLIDSVDETLVTCGAQLTCYRAALFARMAPHIKDRYEVLSEGREDFDSEIVPSWDLLGGRDIEPQGVAIDRDRAREELQAALTSCREEERARRRALVGPHADAVHFMIDGLDASSFASQGQQRSLVLAYKLAETAVIEDVLGRRPVLLLDDVMSELDDARREALINYISDDIQTFITAASLSCFDPNLLSQARLIKLPLD